MGTAGNLLHMRTKRSVRRADRTSIGRNHLASRDCLRGSPLYIGAIISVSKETCGNSKGRVEGMSKSNSNLIKLVLKFTQCARSE